MDDILNILQVSTHGFAYVEPGQIAYVSNPGHNLHQNRFSRYVVLVGRHCKLTMY